MQQDYHKPDGLTIVTPEKLQSFLDPLKIRDIPGIGNKTEEKFLEMNIEKIEQLQRLDVFTLNQTFGRKTGTYIYNAARGIDNEQVTPRAPRIQYSKIMTLKKDSKDYDYLLENINELCEELHGVILKNNIMFKSVGIQFVQSDMSNKSKSKMLRNPTLNLEELQKTAQQLLHEALENQELTIRRLGIKVSELSDIQGQGNITSYF